MRVTFCASVLLLTLVISRSPAAAETLSDSALGFTLELPAGFAPRPDLVGAAPRIVHAYELGQSQAGDPAVLLLIEKMGGVIGRERLNAQQMPPGFNGKLFVTTWEGF